MMREYTEVFEKLSRKHEITMMFTRAGYELV